MCPERAGTASRLLYRKGCQGTSQGAGRAVRDGNRQQGQGRRSRKPRADARNRVPQPPAQSGNPVQSGQSVPLEPTSGASGTELAEQAESLAAPDKERDTFHLTNVAPLTQIIRTAHRTDLSLSTPLFRLFMHPHSHHRLGLDSQSTKFQREYLIRHTDGLPFPPPAAPLLCSPLPLAPQSPHIGAKLLGVLPSAQSAL